MPAGISALAYSLPEGVLSHKELQKRFGSEEMDRLIKNTGIKTRRVCLENECSSDLAFKAAKSIFETGITSPKEIDFVIFSTQMPDYLMPTTACILQDRLSIPKSAGAFDINLGCSQYVYAHSNAYALIQSGLAKKVLVMTGDTPSRIVNPMDRSVVPLFGDAGTAAIIEDLGNDAGYEKFNFGTDGSGYDSLIWPTSGMRKLNKGQHSAEIEDKYGSIRSANDMYMDGQKIFLFTLKTVPKTLASFLNENSLDVENIDFFAFHQASELILDSIVKKMKIPKNKFNRIYTERGNSGGSTVAISLHHAVSEGKIKPGDKVVLSAFGVGLSWAHALMTWPEKMPISISLE